MRIMGGMNLNIPASFAVYFLVDPRSPRHPRYVGVTQDPIMRAYRHARRNTTNPQMGAWKRALSALGLAPQLIVYATYSTRQAAHEAEWRLVHRWQRRGLCDCNTGAEGALEIFRLRSAGMRARLVRTA